MRILGVLFVIFGAFWTIAGFVSNKSDIQLAVASSGMNMFGIGCIMFHKATRDYQKSDSSECTE